MSFYLHPDAEAELLAAIAYYEEIRTDLGHDFAVEVYSAIQRAVSMPESWALIDANIRRSLVSRFPYGVLYSEVNDKIYILAVMNLHRNPDYWKSRC